jgi:hypothetical protein
VLRTQFPAGMARRRAAARPGAPAEPAARRPWWAWAAPFAVMFAVLLARNAFLFSTPLYEDADMGANSILIEQARRFTLLVGNYSREKFNHPGPAFLYVESWGESLLWSVLHAVPTAWNGQLIALYALNSLFAAWVVTVGHGWTRSPRGALAAFAAVLALAALHPAAFSSDWMPYVYVPAYFAYLIAVSSVAAGNLRDLWIATVTGWFLINGHAVFLLFVPALAACAVAALAWPRRHRLGAAFRSFLARQRRAWVPCVVLSALFLVPIVAELVLHWPGNFGKYFGYGTSSKAGGHRAAHIADYALWFWWPHPYAWAVVLVLYAAACAAVWLCPAGPVRRVCASLVAFDTVSTLLVLVYETAGIDELNQHYIAYFYWSAPVVMLLAAALAATEIAARRPVAVTAVVAACAVAACAVFAAEPQTRISTTHVDPNEPATGSPVDPMLPAGVARLHALSRGRPVVLRFQHSAWPEVTGILVQAERTGVRACVASPYWKFMMTSQFICDSAELARGVPFWLYVPGSVPRGAPVAFRFLRATATSRP